MNYEAPFLILGFTSPIGAGSTTLARNVWKITTRRWLERNKHYEEVNNKISSISSTMKADGITEDELERNHRELIRALQEREHIEVLKRTKEAKFQYISMSSLIIKLAVDKIGTKEYRSWKQRHLWLAELLEKFAEEHQEALALFKRKGITFKSLTNEQVENVDRMLLRLRNLRNKVRDQELTLFFQNEIESLFMQDFGDNLRATGNPFKPHSDKISNGKTYEHLATVAKEVNKVIKYYRNRPTFKRHCFVIDAFRNPAELEFFRRRYEQFYLISLYASEERRKQRLKKDVMPLLKRPDEASFSLCFRKLDRRDWGSDVDTNELHKQNVSRCCYLSDIAIENNEDVNKKNPIFKQINLELFKKFLRYYALIVAPGCTQPTKEETYMNLAYSLSLRSSCISRQVGAVVTDSAGYVLGMGWNDACHGQIGCGLKHKQDFIGNVDTLFSQDLFKDTIKPEDLAKLEDTDSICFKDILSEKLIIKKLKEKCGFSNEEAAVIAKKVSIDLPPILGPKSMLV